MFATGLTSVGFVRCKEGVNILQIPFFYILKDSVPILFSVHGQTCTDHRFYIQTKCLPVSGTEGYQQSRCFLQ